MARHTFRSHADIEAEIRSGLEDKKLEERIHFLGDQLVKLSFQFEVLKRRYAVIDEVLRQRDVVLQKYGQLGSVVLAQAATVNARDLLDPADGFYELEYERDGTPFRWTGPTNFVRFVVWIDRATELIVRVETGLGGDKKNSGKLTIDVDGKVYPLKAVNKHVSVAGPIAKRSTAGPTEILLHVPTVFKPSEQGRADPRSLGLQFRSLEVAHADVPDAKTTATDE